MTRLSIVISTYNRAAVLRDVLADLRAQVDAPAFEIVVIDDGSSDDTRAVVEEAQAALPSGVTMQIVHQSNQGLAAARNTGAAASGAEVIAFLDDDVVVPPHWVRAVCTAFDDPTVAAIGGRIELQFECAVPSWFTVGMRHYLGELTRGDDPEQLRYPDFPIGANYAVRRDVWERIGGLDTKFGYKAGSLVPNEERQLFRQLDEAGLHVRYWPAATVRHRMGAARLTRDWFRRRVRGQGLADGIMDLDGRSLSPGVVAREIVRPLRAVPILARNVLAGRGPLSSELWLRYCAGRWSALHAARRAQRGESTTA